MTLPTLLRSPTLLVAGILVWRALNGSTPSDGAAGARRRARPLLGAPLLRQAPRTNSVSMGHEELFSIILSLFLLHRVTRNIQQKRRDHGTLVNFVKHYVMQNVVERLLRLAKRWNVFGARTKIEAEVGKLRVDFDTELGKNLVLGPQRDQSQNTNDETPSPKEVVGIEVLPERGLGSHEIVELLTNRAQCDFRQWDNPRVSGAIYYAEQPGGRHKAQMSLPELKETAPPSTTLQEHHQEHQLPSRSELTSLMTTAYAHFLYANPLHADLFNNCRQMEAEVVAWVADLFTPQPPSRPFDAQPCGCLTTGGTESILMAMLCYRNRWREANGILSAEDAHGKLGDRVPNIVLPVTAHAAFDKAACYFGLKLRKCGISAETGRVDLDEVRNRTDEDTICIVGSAPNYPNGAVDDIAGLSEICFTKTTMKTPIPLHVDSCLGGFLLPFLSAQLLVGNKVSRFDFSVPAVSSISVDMHKYGFTAKGASCILYRHPAIRQHQFMAVPDWTGGIYATPTVAGSRNGASAATTWAVLLRFGKQGYRETAFKIVAAARYMEMELQIIKSLYGQLLLTPGGGLAAGDEEEVLETRNTASSCGLPLVLAKYLKQLGSCDTSVFCLRSEDSKKVNIYAVAAVLTKVFGWSLNSLQNPASVHLCVTLPVAEELLARTGFMLHNSGEVVDHDLDTRLRKHIGARMERLMPGTLMAPGPAESSCRSLKGEESDGQPFHSESVSTSATEKSKSNTPPGSVVAGDGEQEQPAFTSSCQEQEEEHQQYDEHPWSPFVGDLCRAVEMCLQDPKWNKEAGAGVYGMTANIPNAVAADLTKVYIDSCYKVQKRSA
mmetsp:Transcript_20872/g.52728  ORF Transcript_20872/g.52728 Transcript_20872/m.52728 type:complete len:834 (+) Transcript_20872:118-2619(+)